MSTVVTAWVAAELGVDAVQWLEQLPGGTRIHALPVPTDLPCLLRAPRATGETADVLGSGWASARCASQVLTHQYFWMGNTLRRDGALTGVVDWSGGGLAPRGLDLSWARLDLVLLHDEDTADALVAGYGAAGGVVPRTSTGGTCTRRPTPSRAFGRGPPTIRASAASTSMASRQPPASTRGSRLRLPSTLRADHHGSSG